MKLGNGVRILSLGLMLALTPEVSSAKSNIEGKIQSIIEIGIKNAYTVSLVPPVFVHGNCAETQEGKPVQIMYYRTTKTGEKVGIILIGISYNKKEMGGFQKTIVGGTNGPFDVYIAPEGTDIIPTASFHVVKINQK